MFLFVILHLFPFTFSLLCIYYGLLYLLYHSLGPPFHFTSNLRLLVVPDADVRNCFDRTEPEDLKPRELDSAEGPHGAGLAVLVSPWPEILRTDQICIIAYK